MKFLIWQRKTITHLWHATLCKLPTCFLVLGIPQKAGQLQHILHCTPQGSHFLIFSVSTHFTSFCIMQHFVCWFKPTFELDNHVWSELIFAIGMCTYHKCTRLAPLFIEHSHFWRAGLVSLDVFCEIVLLYLLWPFYFIFCFFLHFMHLEWPSFATIQGFGVHKWLHNYWPFKPGCPCPSLPNQVPKAEPSLAPCAANPMKSFWNFDILS